MNSNKLVNAVMLILGLVVGISITAGFASWSASRGVKEKLHEMEQRQILPGAERRIDDLQQQIDEMKETGK